MSFIKLWAWLREKVLTVKIFDLFLQGTLLIIILLEHNCYLLLRRTSESYIISLLAGDFVTIGVGVLEFLAGAFVAWLGRGRRQLALSFWLTLPAVFGLIVLAFPYQTENLPLAQLCGFTPIPELSGFNAYMDEHTAADWRIVFLVATLAACSLAKVSIWAHGLTFLDDKEPQNGAYFYGILISIQLSLGLSGKEWLRPSANSADWWVPQLCICLLTIMFAVLFLLFKRDDRKERSDHNDGFLSSLKRVLTNRTVILQIGALGFLNIGLFKFLQYDDLYAQARYHVDVLRSDLRSSGLLSSIFRPIVIIFFILIFRMRFSGRRSEGVKANTAARVGAVVALFAAALFVAIATIDCAPGDIAGLNGGVYSGVSCSTECYCNTRRHGFIPVCGVNTTVTYFSPCEAGCTGHYNLNDLLVFFDCACDPIGATRGACGLSDCHLIYALYQVFVTLVLAIGGVAMLMQGMSILRAVRPSDKPVAMGVMMAVVALTANTLGHLIYLLIDHETCAFFRAERCDFHNPSIYLMPVVSAVCAALAACVSAAAARWPTKVDVTY